MYADSKSMPSNEVYLLFKKNGILKILDEDYDLIHGMSFQYIIDEIDKMLRGETH